MTDAGLSDLAFVAAAYFVILGAVGLYSAGLVGRLRRARLAASLSAPPGLDASAPPAEPPA
jgi:hypothetical protein